METIDVVWMPNRVIRDPELSHQAVVVYGLLRSYSDSIIDLPLRQLAQDLSVTPRTIRRALDALEAKSLIERVHRSGDTNVIVLKEVV